MVIIFKSKLYMHLFIKRTKKVVKIEESLKINYKK